MCAFTGIRVCTRARAASLVWSRGARHLQPPFVTHTWVCVLYEFTTHLWVSGVCHLHPRSWLIYEFVSRMWVYDSYMSIECLSCCTCAPSHHCHLTLPSFPDVFHYPLFTPLILLLVRASHILFCVYARMYTCTRDCASHPVFLHTLERVRLKTPRILDWNAQRTQALVQNMYIFLAECIGLFCLKS